MFISIALGLTSNIVGSSMCMIGSSLAASTCCSYSSSNSSSGGCHGTTTGHHRSVSLCETYSRSSIKKEVARFTRFDDYLEQLRNNNCQ